MTTTRALVVSADDAVLTALRRLAAAAHVTLDVTADPATAATLWPRSALVLVGVDLAPTLAAGARPPRGPEVLLVAATPVDDRTFRHAVALGARQVLELPEADAWLAAVLADLGDGVTGTGRVVGLVPGSGGAGASTLAAAVAQVAARDRDSTLVDLDHWGAGADRTLGLQDVDGIRWGALADLRGRLGARDLRAALPGERRLRVLGWSGGGGEAPEPAVVVEVLGAAARGSDLVVVDLPRGLDHPAAGAAAARCDELVLCLVDDVRSVVSAARARDRSGGSAATESVVVRTGVGGADPDDVAAALGLSLRAVVPTRRRVPELVQLGAGPAGVRRSPLVAAARALVQPAPASGSGS